MSRLERLLLAWSSLAVAVSGCVVGWMKYFLRADDPYAVANHPLQPIFLKIHVLSAPVLIFALGLVFSRHVLPHFQAGLRHARRSGLVTGAVIAPMIASGYLIQTITGEVLVAVLVAAHAVAGGLYLAGFLTHRVTARRSPREEQPSLRGFATPRPHGAVRHESHGASAATPPRPSSDAMDRRASSTKAI